MTRKEVCKAAGISVKTLRLYEEKGLISPAREYRNGREYREYTPAILRELERIVILRRALFTMDEIKTMQTQPGKIPEVFRDYQLWLEQQSRQFQLLHQTASRVQEHALYSLDSLISELKLTAEKMPLPKMDIKPNFKRLDEMEEPPRHVVHQVNFDETVPNARVFRQVNLVMDRDKANNVNIAFGFYNDMKREQGQAAGGPVEKEVKTPLWFKILSLIATVLLLGSAALVIMDHRQGKFWMFMFVMTALRVAMAQLPHVMDHRKWSKEHMEATQEQLRRERQRKSKIVLLCCLALVVVCGLVYGLYRMLDVQMNPVADYRVCFGAQGYLSEKEVYAMEHVIEAVVGDLDGNGKECTIVEYESIRPNDSRLMSRIPKYMEERVQEAKNLDGERTVLFFFANIENDGFNICDEFSFNRFCQSMPEDLQAKDNTYCVDVTGLAMFEAVDLGNLPVYACISKSATEEEYQFAVELLQKMLERS